MSAKIALQLYSIRELLADDFEGGVRKIAAMGYEGVEPAGFPGTTPEAAGALFKELGLAICSAHTRLPLGDDKQEVLDAMDAIDCPRIVSGLGPKDVETLDDIRRSCERLNEANAVALEHGMTFGLHNHWWEFEKLGGRYVHDIMIEHLDAKIFFQPDTYWIRTAGVDPAKVIANLGPRAPLLHIKDGPAVKGEPMVAAGDGVMDFPAIVAAGEPYAKWWIVELDRCATGVMEAGEKGLAYLKSLRGS